MKIFKNDLSTEIFEISESLLFNGNGHIGIRNTLEEKEYSHFVSNRHTYINSFYDSYPINHPEQYFGASRTGEQMLPVIDGSLTQIKIGREFVDLEVGEISEHERYLDLEKGLSVRSYLYKDKSGNQTRISYQRLTSFEYKEQLITKYQFEKINHELPIELITHLRFSIDRNVDKNDPRVAHQNLSLNILSNNLEKKQILFEAPHSKLKGYFSWEITNISKICLLKDGIEVSSKVEKEYIKAYSYSLESFIRPIADFERLEKCQTDYLSNFWTKAKVSIHAKDDIETSVNYGSFALLQSVGRGSIAAKGLSGIGYEGHVFWDAEMYVLPFFNKIAPKIAREMLFYRINKLDKAIENRKLVGYPEGALYPWRTISGAESSSFFEAGMAQHHISVDISYALVKYIEQSGDISILNQGGYQMMHEVAKMFASILSKNEAGYHLDLVTGPDEYNALVSDNFYTNVLVKKHFENLVRFTELVDENLCISNEELAAFREIAENMVLPFDHEKEIIMQDRDFLNKTRWPYPIKHDKPLLLKHHPLEIYRYQISKQADAILALQLVGPELYTDAIIYKSIIYYDEVTTHDSSLSFSNFATVYARLRHEKAYRYFLKNARLDLDNLHHNTKDGIHTASMGGTYQTLVDGFSNYRIENGQIKVDNLLPKEIDYLEYKVEYQGKSYSIELKQGQEAKVKEIKKEDES